MINREKKHKCECCGDEAKVQVGHTKIILNGTDYSKIVEDYWGKGVWLCEECVFK